MFLATSSKFIHPDGHLGPRWDSQMLTRITLSFPLPLSWNPDLVLDQIGRHQLLAGMHDRA